MTIIRIHERLGLGQDANAELSFDATDTYPVQVTNPFSEAEEQRLEWYFEQWLRFPFIDEVKARDAEASITRYGETLFQ
jgi:hypothetical protein